MTTTEPRTEPLKTQGSAGNDGKQAPERTKRKGLLSRFWLVLTVVVVVIGLLTSGGAELLLLG